MWDQPHAAGPQACPGIRHRRPRGRPYPNPYSPVSGVSRPEWMICAHTTKGSTWPPKVNRQATGGQRMTGVAGSASGTQDAAAFAPGGGGQPAGKRGRVADVVQLIHELEPGVLGGVFGVGSLQPVPAADRPDQRGIPFHQRVPGLPLAVPGQGHQGGDHRVIAPAAGLMGEGRARDHGLSWSWSGSNPYRVPGAPAVRQRTTGSRASAAAGGCGPSGPMRRVMT